MLGLMLGLSLFGGLLSFVPPVQADDEKEVVNPVVQPTIPVPDFLPAPDVGTTGGETQNYILNETIPRVINIVIGLMGIATFLGILIASVQLLTAYGNEDKMNKTKNKLK